MCKSIAIFIPLFCKAKRRGNRDSGGGLPPNCFPFVKVMLLYIVYTLWAKMGFLSTNNYNLKINWQKQGKNRGKSYSL